MVNSNCHLFHCSIQLQLPWYYKNIAPLNFSKIKAKRKHFSNACLKKREFFISFHTNNLCIQQRHYDLSLSNNSLILFASLLFFLYLVSLPYGEQICLQFLQELLHQQLIHIFFVTKLCLIKDFLHQGLSFLFRVFETHFF